MNMDEKRKNKKTDNYHAAFKVPLVSPDELKIAKLRGENVSYEEEDRYVEAYRYNNTLYIVGTKDIGPRE